MVRTAGWLLLLLACGFCMAQETETKPALRVEASVHYGFIIAHRASMNALQRDHVHITEFSLLQQTNGSKTWHSLYHYPKIGLKYLYFDLGNKSVTGFAHTLMPVTEFNPYGLKNVKLQFGFGAAYFTKTFDVDNNYRNLAMGSHFSLAVNITTSVELQIARLTSLLTGISFSHFSNGAIKTPNLGYNIPALKAGIIHKFGQIAIHPQAEKGHFEKKWRKSFCLGAGTKQRYPVNGPNYGVVSFSFTGMRQTTPKSAWGAGADVHYDESLHTVLENAAGQKAPVKDAFRAGVCLSYEQIFSDFSLIIQGGRYIYSKHNSEGKFYQRLGMRYSFYQNWFVCLNLRSHFGKADFFEAGTGIKF